MDTPDAILAAIQTHSEWTDRQRAEAFDRLIAAFEPEQIAVAVKQRLGDLCGHAGEVVLRLVDALDDPALFDALAGALIAQPDLPADRAWEALSLLHEAGLLEVYPELFDRWDELAEDLDEEGVLDQLIDQLESGDVWVALHALGAVEPDVRAQIIAGLAGRRLGPGQISFLRLLTYCHDPLTRTAALDALSAQPGDDPQLLEAWAAIAVDHPDPHVVERARRWLGREAEAATGAWAPSRRPSPRLVRSLVTARDAQGQAYVVLGAEDCGHYAAAAYLCDEMRGVIEVIGREGSDRQAIDDLFAEFASRPQREAFEGDHERALGRLSCSLSLCGPQTTPALRYWIEQTAGPAFRASPSIGLIGKSE